MRGSGSSSELKFLLFFSVPSYLIFCCCCFFDISLIQLSLCRGPRFTRIVSRFIPHKTINVVLISFGVLCDEMCTHELSSFHSARRARNTALTIMMEIIQFYKYKWSPLIYLDLFDGGTWVLRESEWLDAIFFCFFIAAGDEIDVPLVKLSSYSFRCTSSPVRSLSQTHTGYYGCITLGNLCAMHNISESEREKKSEEIKNWREKQRSAVWSEVDMVWIVMMTS